MMKAKAALAALLLAGLIAACAAATAALAETAAPTASDLLFDMPQWQKAAPGLRLAYRYERNGLEAVVGAPVSDRLLLVLSAGDAPDRRTVKVDMFSGAERRAAGPFEDVSGNPALLLFLEHHLETLARVLAANPRYLKNAIRASLREAVVVTPITTGPGAEGLPGWRVEVRPFEHDPNAARMRGLETLTYTFLTSEQVPGAIVAITARATSADGARLLEEKLTYDPSID